MPERRTRTSYTSIYFNRVNSLAVSFKPMKSIFILINASVLLYTGACASAYRLPEVISADKIVECEFIASVEGSSGIGKQSNWQVIAKRAALEQAAKLFATHVVWENLVEVSSGNGLAIGKAYKCSS